MPELEQGTPQPYRIVVCGIPKGQPRHRAFLNKHTNRVCVYDNPVADDWKARVIQEAELVKPDAPLEGPLSVDIAFYLPRPKSRMRKCDPDGPIPCTTKPDRDNLDKCVLDALTQIRFWLDDCQVVDGRITKAYHAKAGRPGAVIEITQLVAEVRHATTAGARPVNRAPADDMLEDEL